MRQLRLHVFEMGGMGCEKQDLVCQRAQVSSVNPSKCPSGAAKAVALSIDMPSTLYPKGKRCWHSRSGALKLEVSSLDRKGAQMYGIHCGL